MNLATGKTQKADRQIRESKIVLSQNGYGRLLDGHHGSVPFELVKDGDLLLLIDRMLHLRGLDTVRISKVKGHADDCMVLDGWVQEVDRLGNDAADMGLLTLVVGELVMLSLMLEVICLGSVVAGTLFFLIFIDF